MSRIGKKPVPLPKGRYRQTQKAAMSSVKRPEGASCKGQNSARA